MNIKDRELQNLSLTLKRVFNKVYLHNIDSLLKKIEESVELSPKEKEALRYLSQDLNDLNNKSKRNKNYGRFF